MIEVDVKQKVLAANAAAAATLRATFEASGTLVANLISSPGSGKTTLLEKTAAALKSSLRLGALEGDIIVGFDDQPIAGIDELHKLLTEDRIGHKSSLVVIRGTEKLLLEVVPEESQSGMQ